MQLLPTSGSGSRSSFDLWTRIVLSCVHLPCHSLADGTVPLDKSAEEFRIHVSWPAAWDNGTAVERTKTVR